MIINKDIIEDIFIAYKLNFTLEELLYDKSILIAYELSQALNGSIKSGMLSCKIDYKIKLNVHYYWCSIRSTRIDPFLKHHENSLTDIFVDNIYYPSIFEIAEVVSSQYKHCLELFKNYKEEEE